MLWVDEQRPSLLKHLSYHDNLTQRLTRLSADAEMPHLLFFGPPGAGKSTRIGALLRAIFGAGADRKRLEHREFKTPSKKAVEITTIASNFHIEMSPADAGNQDRFVIQEIIKEVASHRSLHAGSEAGKGEDAPAEEGRKAAAFKVVVLMEVDRLSRQAQAALRRTMEKYSSSCRLILCASTLSKVIDPVRSRCLRLRVPLPSHEEVCDVLSTSCRKKGLTLPPQLARRISEQTGRNLRRALLVLEATYVQNYPFREDQEVTRLDWEVYIGNLAREITREQTPTKLLKAREMLYELLTNCIPADLILERLLDELLKSLDDTLKPEIVHWAAFYSARIAQGSKEIFHLEAFVAKFMSLYAKHLIAMFC